MQIDKAQIVDFLRQRGDHDQADKAEQHLPDKVDTEEHGGLLAQHGISIDEVKDKLGGLGNIL